MERRTIQSTDTIYNIIEAYPETREIFIANGFPQLTDDAQLARIGKMLTFKAAMQAKKKNPEIFMTLLEEIIEQKHIMAEEGISTYETEGSCTVAGILPCPIKIPLIDQFTRFEKEYGRTMGKSINYRLQSASGGLGWLEDEIREVEELKDLPDLIISAGFELFFDPTLYGKHRDQNAFEDLSALPQFNSCFDGLDLKDTQNNYSIVGGVPAIFLVDTLELHGRKAPETWDDLLSEEFTGSISLPVEDFDLFNAVCLTLYKNRGIEAIKALGRNMLGSMHPAQMVKNKKDEIKPAVTVLPWFFTRMVFPGTSLQVVWPKDGSILSPIFLASKQEKREELAPIVEFFESEEVGVVMRDKGFFPSVNPAVDNGISSEQPFQWLGWDFIYSHDIAGLIKECTETFNASQGAVK